MSIERQRRLVMSKFVIAPHMRLQEWVAEEKGYFAAEGLDYEFRDELVSRDGKRHDLGDKVGAYQTFEKGRTTDVSCACHWTVNVAASNGHGKLYADAYSVSPAGIFVPPDSPVREPADLAGVPDFRGLSIGQPLRHHPGSRTVPAARRDQAVVRRWPAVQTDGAVDRRPGPGGFAVQRPLLLSRTVGLSQGYRHHLHDGVHDHGRSRSGRRAQILPRSAPRATGHRSPARTLYALLQEGNAGAIPRVDGHAPLGTRRAHRV